MANAEARALLDQLMGADRDAPLPSGAALPRKRGAPGDASHNDSSLLLPGKRHKSCYDRDICPLYCAWGVDVYDLFVNTKSDIGPNPYKVDDSARDEYQKLPQQEQEQLGFEHMLFVKLGELVQQCDRTVTRNNEKLKKELSRQKNKRGGHDYVQDVDDGAVEQLIRHELMIEDLKQDIVTTLEKLKAVKSKEDELKNEVEALNKQEKGKDDEEKTNEGESSEDAAATADGDTPKEEAEKGSDTKKEEEKEEGKDEDNGSSEVTHQTPISSEPKPPSPKSLELGKATLEKQAMVCDIARKLVQLKPLEDTVEKELRNLNHVRSDTTTDKTVCEVSGNFMSARDADERIAAHYAGKQYVGWKLVREKFKQMLGKYGKYGPPPPGRGGPGGPMLAPRGGPPPRGSGGGGFDRRGSGGPRHGGRGYDRGGDRGGRWERDGGGHRGGGGYGGPPRGGNGGWGRR